MQAGFTLSREGSGLSGDINTVTFSLAKLPIIKLTGADSYSGPEKVEAEYPIAVVSPNRIVLERVWEKIYGNENSKRPGRLRPFRLVFDDGKTSDRANGMGLQHPQATVLDPKKWNTTDKQLLEWLTPCVVEAAVRTLTADVSWNPRDINASWREKRLHVSSPFTVRLSPDQFERSVIKAKNWQWSGQGDQVINNLLGG